MSQPAPQVKWALVKAIRLTGLKYGQLAAAVFFGALTQGASVALAGASAWLIVRASQMPPVLSLQVAVVLVRTFGITRGVSRYVERLTAHRVALGGMTELRVRLYQRMAEGSPAKAASLRRGDILARVGADVEDVGDLVVRGIVPTLVAAVLMVASSLAVAFFLPLAGLALFACLALVAVGGPLLTLRAAKLSELLASRARAAVATASLDILEHAPELQVAGNLAAATQALSQHEQALFRATEATAKPTARAAWLTEAAVGLALLACLVLGAWAFARGQLTATELGIVTLLPMSAFEAVAGLPAAAAQVYRSRAAAARIIDLADAATDSPRSKGQPRIKPAQSRVTPPGPAASVNPADGEPLAAPDQPVRRPRRAKSPQALTAPTASAPASNPPADQPGLAGPLTARDLACAWPDHPAVVSGVSLDLAGGQSLGIAGPSGVGKTTLLATLAGLLPPAQGQVQVAGHDLSGLDSTTRAHTVAFIAEDAHIFATTVLENLRVVRGNVTPDQALDALTMAGLAGWLEALPDGLDSLLGGGGTTVSGGERRRLLLARALLSPARYILLDEPAEHLDPEGADRLTAELLNVAKRAGRGVLMVSHRLSALATADSILVLADGQVAAQGTHQQLLNNYAPYKLAMLAEDLEN